MASKKIAKNSPMTKQELINALVDTEEGLTRIQVKHLLDSLQNIGHKQLKRTGQFNLPGFAKFKVSTRKRTPARTWKNPRTGQAVEIAAKPAHKIVRAQPTKAIKDSIS